MAKKKLYALLVGIDKYPPGVRSLKGCVNDMNAFKDYLVRQCRTAEYEPKISILSNEKAKRQDLIAAFDHFSKAKNGDTCVFYFSGHGSRIPSSDFWEAFDGKNEAIVCHDACLVDKELSCLIYEATKGKSLHFLTVMDCCYSGGNSRDDAEVVNRLSRPNRYPVSIEEYHGYKEGWYLRDANGTYTAPKGKHLHFAACRNHQTAKETEIDGKVRGAFTYSLIEALDTSKTSLSYLDLERRVKQKITNIADNQAPQVEPIEGEDVNATFLGGALAPKNRFFAAWNKVAKVWEVNAGIYHGMSKGKIPSELTVEEGNRKLQIGLISPESTRVTWGAFEPDPQKQYPVRITMGGANKRQVAFAKANDADINKTLLSTLKAAKLEYVQFTDRPENASFFVQADAKGISLTQLGNAEPVFVPVKDLKKANEFWLRVEQVMQWYHILHLENGNPSDIDPEKIQVELYRSEGIKAWHKVDPKNMERIDKWDRPVDYHYREDQLGEVVNPSFAMSIKNTSDKELYVSAMFLNGRYGIDNRHLPVEKILPQGMVWLTASNGGLSSKSIGLAIDDGHYEAGLTELNDFVKLLISTQDMNTTGFNQDSLQIRKAPEIDRDSTLPTIANDWITKLIPIRIIRPQAGEALIGGRSTVIQNKIKISAPQGFAAQLSLAHQNTANRGESDSDELDWPEGFTPLALTQGMLRSTGLSVIALENLEGIENISPAQPLELAMTEEGKTELGKTEMFMAFTKKGKFWYPLGLPGDATHPAKVTQLSAEMFAESPDDNERSLGRALKLFLYKIAVGKPIIGKIADRVGKKPKDLYQLAMVEVPADLEKEVKYHTNPAQIADKVKAAQRILLFTHGYVGATDDHIKLVRRIQRQKDGRQVFLQDHYDLILTFDYETLASPIDTIANKLKADLEEIGIKKELFEGKTLHVIAHSMGGIVTRWWIELLGGNALVSHYIQAGAPNDGAKITRLYDLMMLGLTHAINLVPIPGVIKGLITALFRFAGLDTIDDNIGVLTPGSATLKELARVQAPGIPYTILSADTAKIPKLEKQKLSFLQRMLRNLGYKIAKDLIFKEPNDLVVGVSSSRAIPHPDLVQKTETIACDHFGFFRTAAGIVLLGEVMWKLLDEEQAPV